MRGMLFPLPEFKIFMWLFSSPFSSTWQTAHSPVECLQQVWDPLWLHVCLPHLSTDFVCPQLSHPPSQPSPQLQAALACLFPTEKSCGSQWSRTIPCLPGLWAPSPRSGASTWASTTDPISSLCHGHRVKSACDFKCSSSGLSVRWDSQILFSKVCHTQDASASCPALAKNPFLHNKVLSAEKWHIPSQILLSWTPSGSQNT